MIVFFKKIVPILFSDCKTGQKSELVVWKFMFSVFWYAYVSAEISWYTGGILQRLDTDVHSAVTAKMSSVLWQRKRAQCCDGNGADSNVTALTVTALGHQWLWHRCDSDVYISVTAMATDSAVTAVTTDSAVSAVAADTTVTTMFTLVWQRWQLTLLWQRWQPTVLCQW